MSDPCENYLRLFRSNDAFDHAMRKYLAVSEEAPGQTILNFGAIAPMPGAVRGSDKETGWIRKHWGAELILESYADEAGLHFATAELPPTPLIAKLAVLSGYDLQFCYLSHAAASSGEMIASADGTVALTEYGYPYEAPQWLLGLVGHEPCEEEVLFLDEPIPQGWGRVLTAAERLRAAGLLGYESTQGFFVRRSVPDLSGLADNHQLGRIHGPTGGEIRPIGFAQFRG